MTTTRGDLTMRFRYLITGSLVIFVLSGPGVHGALAQVQKVERTVRVEQPGALVRVRASPKAEVLAPAPVNTLLVVLDRDADWLWVLLPADAHGTKRPGWIRASEVEKSATPEPGDESITPGPAKKQKPPKPVKVVIAELKPVKIPERKLVKPVAALKLVKPVLPVAPVAADTRRLDKAKRDLEKARQAHQN